MKREKKSSKASPTKEAPPRIPVRTKVSSEITPRAQALITHLLKACNDTGRCWTYFVIDELPRSLNHQYGQTRFGGTYLKKEIREFRARISLAMGEKAAAWRPSGHTAALIVMMSPVWVTNERLIRKMDLDNKVKALLDAVEKATGAADERHWELHIFKAYAKRERTIVYLFDLGDVVEYHY